MNWKYILIVLILATIVVGGILAYQYLWAPKREVKIPEIKSSTEVPSDKTADWKTYRSEKYGMVFKYPTYAKILPEYNPIYRDGEGPPPPGVRYFSAVWGPIVPSKGIFGFEFVNPLTGKEAEAIEIKVSIYSLIDYQSPSYYFGPVAYDVVNNRWHKAETREVVASHPFVGSHEIPRIFMLTKRQVPVYQILVYSDVGHSTTNYVIVDNKRKIVAEFSRSFSANDYDMSPEVNQKFVDEISKDFIKILESFSF